MNYIFGGGGGFGPPSATIRTVSSSCRCASNYTSLLWVVIWMMKINHLFGFSELFRAHQTATFLAVLAPTILHSGVVRLPTWCRINWIFVCRASFHQVTASIDALRLLLLHAYYFCASTCQRTILLLSVLRNSRLTQDCRCPNDLLYKV